MVLRLQKCVRIVTRHTRANNYREAVSSVGIGGVEWIDSATSIGEIWSNSHHSDELKEVELLRCPLCGVQLDCMRQHSATLVDVLLAVCAEYMPQITVIDV